MDMAWGDQYGASGQVGGGGMCRVTEYRRGGDHGDWEGGPATGEEQYWSWENT